MTAATKRAKPADDNDLARAGRLPADPLAGTVIARPATRSDAPLLPELPVDTLPPIFQEVAREFAAGFSSPVELAVLPMMAVAGAALGPRWVCGPDGILRPASVWPVAVAPASSGKTPTAGPVLAPLVALDRRLRDRYEDELAAWKAQNRSRRAAARKGPADDDEDPPPTRRRLLVTDTTPEALLGVLQAAEGHGVLLHTDELPTLLGSMDGYRNSGRSGRGMWLSLWSGTAVRSVRKQSDSAEVDRPFVAVYGGVQPSVLRALELSDGDGLCSRFLWAHVAPRVGGLGGGVADEVAGTWRRAVEFAASDAGSDVQRIAPRSPAWEVFDRHLRDWRERAVDLETAGMGLSASFYGKAGDYLARLVALLHGLDAMAEAIDRGANDLEPLLRRSVPAASVERAARLLAFFIDHGLETARLVTSRAPRETDALGEDDQRFAIALRTLVATGPVIDTPEGWRRRLGGVGLLVSDPMSLGHRMRRLSARPVAGLKVQRARSHGKDGKERGWEVQTTGAA